MVGVLRLSICSILLAVATGWDEPPREVRMPSPELPALVAGGPARVTLAAVGDINLGGRVGELIARNGPGYPWTAVAGALQDADVAAGNLECAVSFRGSPEPKEFTFRGDPDAVPSMADAGIDVLSLANNHAVDFGRVALLDTVRAVRAAGIAPVGAGATRGEAFAPAILERHGVRIAFLGATRVKPAGWEAGEQRPGVASAYEERRLIDEVRSARASADIVVVLVHWGTELAVEPNAQQVRLGRALVDAGASVVLGAHPHVLQPVVRYGGGLIAYSLGNFVFSPGTASGAVSSILRVTFQDGGPVEFDELPVRISAGRPRPVGVPDVERVSPNRPAGDGGTGAR